MTREELRNHFDTTMKVKEHEYNGFMFPQTRQVTYVRFEDVVSLMQELSLMEE